MAHVHNILDSDKRFSIDPVTRAITNESKNKVMVMQYDHNSERFTFEVDRHVEGHDMSLSTVAQIHYLNGTNEGVYEADDLQISPDDEEKVIFSWLISRNATQNPTALNFLVKFRCYEEENVVYEWNSAVFNKISVGSGMNGGEVVVEEYTDIIAQWESRILALEEGAEVDLTGYATETYVDEAVANVEVDLSPYAKKTDIPTVPENVSAFNNDAGYLTEHQDLSSYALKTDIPDTSSFITSIPEEYVTEEELEQKGYLTEHQSLDGYAKIEDIPTDYLTDETDPTVPAWAKEATKPTYTAAEVGALPDTTVIPTVPTTVSAFTNDAGYLTAVPSEYVTETELSAKGYLTAVPSEYVTETELTAKGYQTASQVNTLINTALGVIENGTY